MSIAASVVINPSRLLRFLLALLAALVIAVACWIALFAQLAYFESSILSAFSGQALSLIPFVAGAYLFHSAFRPRKSFQLDISGLGEIRLREHDTRAAADPGKSSPDSKRGSDAVRLMDDTTIWPKLLALRLCRADGTRTSLVVLPDMVEPDDFRALLVAIRWIAARGTQQEQPLREESTLP